MLKQIRSCLGIVSLDHTAEMGGKILLNAFSHWVHTSTPQVSQAVDDVDSGTISRPQSAPDGRRRAAAVLAVFVCQCH